MAFLSVDSDGTEWIYVHKPFRVDDETWLLSDEDGTQFTDTILLPKDSIFKLIGRNLTWEDEPVEI